MAIERSCGLCLQTDWAMKRNCHIGSKDRSYRIYLIVSADVCNAIGDDIYDCCTPSNQCGPNQGDCDSNSDCQGDLVCGNDNCQSPFPSDADCCTGNFISFLI